MFESQEHSRQKLKARRTMFKVHLETQDLLTDSKQTKNIQAMGL